MNGPTSPRSTYRTLRVFISSTFRDMQAERDHLVRFVFPRLREELLSRRIHLLDVDLRWGVTSDQDALSVCREIVDECRPRFLCTLGGRYGWVPRGRTLSITSDEIHYGVLDRPGRHGHAFFYFRDPAATKAMVETTPGEFREPPGSENERRLEDLKRAIENAGWKPVLYRAQWDSEAGQLTGLRDFGERVYADLKASVEEESVGPPPGDGGEFAEDATAMEAFIDEHTQRFVLGSREPVLREMAGHANAPGGQGGLCLVGRPGSGKSALLARLADDLLRNPDPSVLLVAHFVGASAGSTDVQRALRRICREAASGAGIPAAIPDDPEKLRAAFPEILRLACARQRVVLLLDAVNQFDPAPPFVGLDWLPQEWPDNARVIFSTAPGPALDGLRRLRCPPRELLLPELTSADGAAIATGFLQRYRKAMTDGQLAALLGKTDARVPLYLLAALEELRTLGNYEQISRRVADLPPEIPTLFTWILARLEDDDGFRDASRGKIGRELVPRFAALLGASRHGLSERELAELLSPGDPAAEPPVPDDAQGNVKALVHLLRPYLMRRGELLDFYHDQFRAAARARTLQTPERRKEAHGALADYFGAQGDWLDSPGARPAPAETLTDSHRAANVRRADELPWQLLRAGQFERLAGLLTNLDFIEAKCAAGRIGDLMVDYAATLEAKGPTPEQGRAIREYSDFLREQSHVLAACPGLTLQQAANGPADSAPTLAARRRLESGIRVRPWLRRIQPSGAGSPCRITFAGHGAAVLSCAVSPDGRLAVSGDAEGTLRWWDLASGAPMAVRKAHQGDVTGCAFSPDGRRVVSASADKTMRLWEAEGALPVLALAGCEAPILACAFSPDGRRLFSCSEESVKVWDAQTGAEREPLVRNPGGLPVSQLLAPEAAGMVTHESSLDAITLSPDGRWAATASGWVGTVKLRDSATGAEQRTFGGESDAREWNGKSASACAFSPDGTLLAGCVGSTLILWERATGARRFEATGHTGSVNACAFSPDGRQVATASSDGTLRLWDSADGSPLGTMSGHLEAVLRCAFSPDGAHVLSASSDRTLKLWNVSAVRNAGPEEGGRLWILARSCDGGILASPDGREGPRAVLLDDEARRVRRPLQGVLAGSARASFSPDGERLVTADDRGLRLWDASTGALVAAFSGNLAKGSWCRFSPDGRRVLTGPEAHFYPGEVDRCELKLWDVPRTRELVALAAARDGFACDPDASLSPDGALVAAPLPDGTMRVWDAATGLQRSCMRHPRAGIHSFRFSPDGSRILTFASARLASQRRSLEVWFRRLILWEAATGAELAEWQAHRDNDGRFCFSPDGKTVLTWETLADTRMQLWEARTGGKIATIDAPGTPVEWAVFSPDGRSIACHHGHDPIEKGRTSLWNADGSGRLLEVRGDPLGFSPDGTRYLAVEEGALKVWDVGTGAEVLRYAGESAVRFASWSSDGRTLAAHLPTGGAYYHPGETLADRIHRLRIEGLEIGPLVATACRAPGRPGEEKRDGAFRCPACRSWTPVGDSAPGSRVACRRCGQAIALNPSTLDLDWRRLEGTSSREQRS